MAGTSPAMTSYVLSRENQHDRVFDLARVGQSGCDRGVGGILVSAEIIQFIRRPKHNREQSDFPTIAFRSAVRPDELTMDHADTAPYEYVRPDQCSPASSGSRGGPAATNWRQKSAVNGGQPSAYKR